MRCAEVLVAPGHVAFDIGANRGLYSARFLRQVGRDGQVHAFEAHPAHRDWLEALGRGVPNFHAHHVALSDYDGTATLNIPVVAGKRYLGMGTLEDPRHKVDGEIEELHVEARRLDSLVSSVPRLDFIKCDVEGHEDSVFAGAHGLLSAHQPTILVELEQRHRGNDPAIAFNRFGAVGLEGWAISGATLKPIDEFDVERDQLRYLDDTRQADVMPLGYVHNFIFAKPGTLPTSLLRAE